MKKTTIFMGFAILLPLIGCFYDVDRSRIPECYTADECSDGQTCSDAGACVKIPQGNGTNNTGDGGACDASSDACQGVSVSGTATMASGLAAECYATGDLYLSLVESCPSLTNQNPGQLASITITDVDFSAAGNHVSFAFQGVAAGTSYLTGFFDHNNNADQADPGPDLNDVLGGSDFSGTGESCVKVVVGDQDLTQVDITMDTAMPF